MIMCSCDGAVCLYWERGCNNVYSLTELIVHVCSCDGVGLRVSGDGGIIMYMIIFRTE